MLIHKGTTMLETKRLRLRRFTSTDAKAMYENWASDPEVTKFLTWPPHASIEVTQTLLQNWIADYDKPNCYHWAITWKDSSFPIGDISVVHLTEKTEAAEIGYCLGRNWWHQGIMSEALQAVVDYLFQEIGMNRVEAQHDPNNPNSGAVMGKCGMQFEGTLRQADRNNQGICDLSIYSILKSEWETHKGTRSE